MRFSVDLRYFLPAFMNTFFFVLPNIQDKVAVDHIDSPYLGLKLALFILALFLLLIFLHVSFQLPINITAHSLLLRTHQGFAIALLVSLAASLLLPPALFWVFFFCIILTYPCHPKLFDHFARFLFWLSRTLHSIPSNFITITRRHQHHQRLPQLFPLSDPPQHPN
ncbi:hypothetical protein PVK06_028485 [Gossypium arboreum]|uniref:Uncharacterized protein n=1 Tax=Gossypium arboreum TaxID=29729 RepID=A0ABR0P4F1_GOSAR|nr:hypothetical protein PVK06_028485 [Gossypium arboreum]